MGKKKIRLKNKSIMLKKESLIQCQLILMDSKKLGLSLLKEVQKLRCCHFDLPKETHTSLGTLLIRV